MLEDKNSPFFNHLRELRSRILFILLSVLIIFLCLISFANTIYEVLASPLLAYLPNHSSMIATDVTSPFITPVKLTLITAIFICVPVILFQVWGFIAPGLYLKERKLIIPLLISSSIMFYIGVAFAYFVVFPLMFDFFTGITLEGVELATDITSYLDFALSLFMAFGIAFEIPVGLVILCWLGIVSPENLRTKRPYIIVFCFIIGMLLTPPDIISQSLLAIPMYLLFEVGLLFSRCYK